MRMMVAHNRTEALYKLKLLAPKFAREVEPLYKKLKWTWLAAHTPTHTDIYQAIGGLIDLLERTPAASVASTGGIEISFDENGAYLRFVKEYAIYWDEVSSEHGV